LKTEEETERLMRTLRRFAEHLEATQDLERLARLEGIFGGLAWSLDSPLHGVGAENARLIRQAGEWCEANRRRKR
jgi:hypothetical protein